MGESWEIIFEYDEEQAAILDQARACYGQDGGLEELAMELFGPGY